VPGADTEDSQLLPKLGGGTRFISSGLHHLHHAEAVHIHEVMEAICPARKRSSSTSSAAALNESACRLFTKSCLKMSAQDKSCSHPCGPPFIVAAAILRSGWASALKAGQMFDDMPCPRNGARTGCWKTSCPAPSSPKRHRAKHSGIRAVQEFTAL